GGADSCPESHRRDHHPRGEREGAPRSGDIPVARRPPAAEQHIFWPGGVLAVARAEELALRALATAATGMSPLLDALLAAPGRRGLPRSDTAWIRPRAVSLSGEQ